ncbi:MAG: hypothetical protein HGA65_01350, partial [Oscillochloris sp.]|nr:hypothetical protein [Oscillochloris sp.]
RYIELDLASGTWSYELAPATASRPAVIWVGRDLFSLPLHLLREKPTQPTTSNSDLITVQGGTSHAFGGTSHAFGGTSHAFGGTSHAFGTDTEANTHTGCVNLPDHAVSFVQEIAHSFRVTPLTGNRVFPDALFFPAGRTLAVTSVGTGGDTLTFGPHGAVGYLTTSNDDTHDVLTTNAAFLRATLQTSDPSKPASLYQIHETDGWTRIYALNNTTIDPDAPLISEVSADLTSLTVINPGAARSYDLGLGHYGSDGVGQVIFPGLPIGAHERRIYTPLTWVDLPHSALLVQVDSDNDGTIDRTDIIGGNVFPAVASLADTPDTPGAELTLIDRQLSRSYYGWADIFHPLTTTLQIDSRNTGLGWLDHDRHNPLRGKLADLLRQIIGGGNPGLAVGDWLIGVPGQNTSLLSEIERQARSRTVAFQPGSLVLVPLYDQTQVVHGRLVAYRIGGFALVEVLSYPHSESSDSRHQSYHDRAIHVRLITRIVP